MDSGKIFEKLLHLAVSKGLIVRFCPFQASEGRLKGNRLGIAQDLTMDKINYNLAHELAHSYLHYDKGGTGGQSRRDAFRTDKNSITTTGNQNVLHARDVLFILKIRQKGGEEHE